MSDLAEGPRSTLTLELIYSHCHIRLNISSENNDIGYSSFKKINFSKISPFKYIRKQIRRYVGQDQPSIII